VEKMWIDTDWTLSDHFPVYLDFSLRNQESRGAISTNLDSVAGKEGLRWKRRLRIRNACRHRLCRGRSGFFAAVLAICFVLNSLLDC